MTDHRQLQTIRRLAKAQHHVMSREQLLGLGVAPSTITDRVRRGDWERLAPGVYDVVCGTPPPHRELMAAVLRTGGVACGCSAMSLWGLVPPPSMPEVAVAPGRRPQRIRARVRRISLAQADLTRRLGIPTFAVERAVVAAADEDVLDAALRLGLTTLPRLEAQLAELPGRRGAARMARMLADRAGESGRTESFAEDRLGRILRSIAGFDWECQHVVREEHGAVIARLDFACVSARIAIEVDGYGSHAGRRAFQADRARRTRLAAAGWTNLVFTYDDVVRRPDWTREQILTAMRTASK